MTSSLSIPRRRGADLAWGIARWTALAAVPLLLLWLVLDPRRSLLALWYVIIPVLPATFFLSARIWRGICPLATLNEMGNLAGRQRQLTTRQTFLLSVAGLLLFHAMVPARHLLFNQNGPALAVTILTVSALAGALGTVFTVRSAFCNALCPVLPVEQLYGQSPLIQLDRGRCSTCVLCVKTGCLDLTDKVIPQLLGTSRRSAQWLFTPHGAFFTALPGFIVGYNRIADGVLASAGRVYATTVGWSLASYVIFAAAVLLIKLSSRIALAAAAALGGGLYYWYAGPSIATNLGTSSALGTAVQVAGIGLVAIWLIKSTLLHEIDRRSQGRELSG